MKVIAKIKRNEITRFVIAKREDLLQNSEQKRSQAVAKIKITCRTPSKGDS